MFNAWASEAHKRGANAAIASGYLKRIIVFDEQLIACEMQKNLIYFNKPIHVGCMVLEHSKFSMYEFHYDIMKNLYQSINLLYMDTDSFVYDITTPDFYHDLSLFVQQGTPHFDTSNYSPSNPFGVTSINKQKLGSMKDELGGKIINKFVALKAKLYAYTTVEGDFAMRAKGVQRKVSQQLTMQEYEQCLNDTKVKIVKEQLLFKSVNHKIYSQVVNKIALSGIDTKRFILKDGIHTLAWGHHKIDELLLQYLEEGENNDE